MTYQSKKHKEIFDKAMVKKNENNYKLLPILSISIIENITMQFRNVEWMNLTSECSKLNE